MVGIYQQLLDNVYNGVSPYNSSSLAHKDDGYPHTNMIPFLASTLFSHIHPTYIVECGTMLGGSAIIMAKTLAQAGQNDIDIVCIDPFTGDVNMWDWEHACAVQNKWRFLALENGVPTIYRRFLANVLVNELQHRIIPINCTTTVGIKLLKRLLCQGRISELPNYIYLDSAHEPDETLLELRACWGTLSCGTGPGVLFGDDWSWEAVRTDVVTHARQVCNEIDRIMLQRIHASLPGSSVYEGAVLLYKGQWVLVKMGFDASPS